MGQQTLRTARRRRLGAELRTLREAAQVSVEAAARRLHGDGSKISRIETGSYRGSRLELETLLDLYGVPEKDKLRDRLIALSTQGRQRSWWRQHGDVLGPGFKELLMLESDTVRIAAFQPLVIPGLLQTREYAAAVITGSGEPLSPEQIDFYVSLRFERQQVFQRKEPPQYVCYVTESVVRQVVDTPRVMADQLRHLLHMHDIFGITIQVIPFRGPYVSVGGAFTLFSYPDPMDLDIVYVEHLDGTFYLQEDATISKYRRATEVLRSAALPSAQSMKLISSIAQELDP
ncbi:helix-turn-helix transcriptional regulator [Streptomyces sp. NPDC050610]|uniref:helix-turn-helix domain-containing protein n=1 Tax=Streptomyces sp. NPDC050610 TaxID=3157097 RepID=UPI00343391BC